MVFLFEEIEAKFVDVNDSLDGGVLWNDIHFQFEFELNRVHWFPFCFDWLPPFAFTTNGNANDWIDCFWDQ
jgi:hypothetical protein